MNIFGLFKCKRNKFADEMLAMKHQISAYKNIQFIIRMHKSHELTPEEILSGIEDAIDNHIAFHEPYVKEWERISGK